MKKAFVFLVVVCLVFCSGVAMAEPYVSGSVGLVITHDSDVASVLPVDVSASYNTGFLGSVAVGSSFDAVRVEGELAYRQADMDQESIGGVTGDLDGKYSSISLMANAYYDFFENERISPFIGCGFGINRVDYDIEGDSDDDSVLAYQLAAGISYELTDKLNLDITYKYLSGQDVDFYGSDIEYKASNIALGVRAGF